MKILNAKNQVIGKVEQDGKNPFHFRYYGNNKVTFPIQGNSIQVASANACKFLGEGCFYLLFTI